MFDCVFDKGKTCAALKHHKCENCSFRKTPKELANGRERAWDRLTSLPKDQYDHIVTKYDLSR